jgi:hypothetical protein
MDEEVRTIVAHGAIGPISAAADIDAPALPCGVAGPDERDPLVRKRRGAEMADAALSRDAGGNVIEPHAVENVLPCGEIFKQQLRGEVAIGQRVSRSRTEDGLEAFDGRAFHAHPRGPVGARPDHRGAGIDVTGLDAARNLRTVGGAAEIGLCDNPGACQRQRGSGSNQHLASGQDRLL